MEEKRSVSLREAKNLLDALTKNVMLIRDQENEVKKKAYKIYNEFREEVKLLIKKFFEEGSISSDPDLRNIIRGIKDIWSELERDLFGPVIIVTRKISFFKSQKRLWEKTRNIEVSENPDEAIRMVSLQNPLIGEKVSSFIVDGESFSEEEIEKFAETVSHLYNGKIPVLIVGEKSR